MYEVTKVKDETVGCLRVFMYDGTYAQIGRVVTSRKIRSKGWCLEMIRHSEPA